MGHYLKASSVVTGNMIGMAEAPDPSVRFDLSPDAMMVVLESDLLTTYFHGKNEVERITDVMLCKISEKMDAMVKRGMAVVGYKDSTMITYKTTYWDMLEYNRVREREEQQYWDSMAQSRGATYWRR